MVLSLEMKTICNSTVSYESDIWNFYNDLLKHSQSETGVTFFIYYHDLPVNQVIKNNLTNVEKSFRSNFGDDTNKLFERMFPSTKELAFTSRFEKIISNVPEVEIVNTSESFLIKNQKKPVAAQGSKGGKAEDDDEDQESKKMSKALQVPAFYSREPS